MSQPHDSGTRSELKLLRSLIDRCDRSAPSQVDVEEGLEGGVGRLMMLEGRLRAQSCRASGTRTSEELCEEQELVEEICALREVITELRARIYPGQLSPLAQGFVLHRKP